jgi:hypothetical protein
VPAPDASQLLVIVGSPPGEVPSPPDEVLAHLPPTVADSDGDGLFDHLDQPVQRVTGAETSPSISRVLEAAACADTADIVAALNTITA